MCDLARGTRYESDLSLTLPNMPMCIITVSPRALGILASSRRVEHDGAWGLARFLIPEPIGHYRYGVEALDGDMDSLKFEEPAPDAYRMADGTHYGPRDIFGGGARVSAVNMPTKMRLTRRLRKALDFDNAGHMYMVTRRFIDIVETFQTDIQYYPLECVWNDSSPAGQYFLFFTTVLLDAVNRKKTTATWRTTRPGKGVWLPKYENQETFVFDKARLGNIHVWVDPNMGLKNALVSDALYGALRAAKIESFIEGGHFEEV